ncbi:unnamed protein product [Mytilus edulis]|uniref:G-protein coupled receptors family 1 profile domain-containing protein n=1 Tax=Mytilus edulis TaxID=6550 RepID=A0A8S3V5V1_MYTED|nr:unnamed protein product [Mytilus edulis]
MSDEKVYQTEQTGEQDQTKDISIAIFLIMIVIVFTVCWAPFMIRIIINQSHSFPRNEKADILSLILASWNQVLDPWVYLLFRGNTLTRLIHYIKKSSIICKTFGRFNCSSREVGKHDATALQLGVIPLTSMVTECKQRHEYNDYSEKCHSGRTSI